MKSLSSNTFLLALTVLHVEAGTNKTLAPTPLPKRPVSPFPTENTPGPSPGIQTISPVKEPVTTKSPVYEPVEEGSMHYVLDSIALSHSKAGKPLSHDVEYVHVESDDGYGSAEHFVEEASRDDDNDHGSKTSKTGSYGADDDQQEFSYHYGSSHGPKDHSHNVDGHGLEKNDVHHAGKTGKSAFTMENESDWNASHENGNAEYHDSDGDNGYMNDHNEYSTSISKNSKAGKSGENNVGSHWYENNSKVGKSVNHYDNGSDGHASDYVSDSKAGKPENHHDSASDWHASYEDSKAGKSDDHLDSDIDDDYTSGHDEGNTSVYVISKVGKSGEHIEGGHWNGNNSKAGIHYDNGSNGHDANEDSKAGKSGEHHDSDSGHGYANEGIASVHDYSKAGKSGKKSDSDHWYGSKAKKSWNYYDGRSDWHASSEHSKAEKLGELQDSDSNHGYTNGDITSVHDISKASKSNDSDHKGHDFHSDTHIYHILSPKAGSKPKYDSEHEEEQKNDQLDEKDSNYDDYSHMRRLRTAK